MFFDTFLPLLGIAAFIFYYRALGAPEVYTGFVVLGGAMTAFWLNVLWSMATQFYWEKETGNLELYMMAPMSRMAVLAGMALGGMFFTSVRAVSTFVLGVFIFQVQMDVSSPRLLAAVFVTTLIAIYGMGMLFASLYMLWGRGAWHLSNLMQEPIYLVSGFYFPVRQLGFWVAWQRRSYRSRSVWTPCARLMFGAGPRASAGDHRAGVAAGCRRWSSSCRALLAPLHGVPGQEGGEADAAMAMRRSSRTSAPSMGRLAGMADGVQLDQSVAVRRLFDREADLGTFILVLMYVIILR